MLRFFAVFFFLVSLALFLSVYISPIYFPYVGLITLTIPLLLVINAILAVGLIFAKRKLAILPILALVVGWKFVGMTYQFGSSNQSREGLSVLTYNVHLFTYSKDGVNSQTQNMMRWLKENPADIKCFQEFFHDPTTPSRNAIKQLGTDAGYHHSYQIIHGNPKKASFGMVIFSRYPIVNDGIVLDSRSTNGIIFADIKVDKDTVRIYNVHLESMNIPSSELDNFDGIKENYRQTLRKLKRGQVSRASQLQVLIDHMENSPYPNILVGDFNDVPYSYTYMVLRSVMDNAFEKAGNGFGFTYNKVLFFLRIDNIFFDRELAIRDFKTHSEVDYSDHYPISAVFTLPFPPKPYVGAEED